MPNRRKPVVNALVQAASESLAPGFSHSPSWYKVSSAAEAALWAEGGYLVIAGLKGTDQVTPNTNGHVVVVVPGSTVQNYPRAYWGQFNGTGKKNSPINYSGVPDDLPKVIYRAASPQGVG